MPILFDVPRTAKSNDFIQKGPTCWYYAAKMLVSMHNLRATADFDRQWKSLHEVRKVISELSSDSCLGGDPSEDLSWLRGRLWATQMQHSQLIDAIEATNLLPHGWYRTHERKKRITILNRTLGMDLEKAISERAALSTARVNMGLAQSMGRHGLLESFMPGVFVEGSMPAAECTIEVVENKLRATGPFYTSGDVWSKRDDQLKRIDLSEMIKNDSIVDVSKLAINSAHAVVVAGVVGKQIYYKDPNNSSEVRIIDFEVFKTGWGRSGTCYYIDIICPNKALEMVGGCAHTLPLVLHNQ